MTPARWGLRIGSWLAVVAGFLLLLRYDVALMQWRHRAPPVAPHGWTRQVLIGFRDFGQVVPFVVVVIIVATFDRRRRSIIVTLVLAELLTAGGYRAGKWLIARPRPCAVFEAESPPASLTAGQTWIGWRPGNQRFEHQSFPSGHTAAAFTFAATLAWFYPQLGWMLWILAVGCAGSRCIDGLHWPSDCVAGAVIGYAAAWLAIRLSRPFRHGGTGNGQSG